MDRFENWAEAATFFLDQERLLGGHELRLSWQSAFSRVSAGGRPSTDRAVRSYIARREWPALEDADRFELLLRLRCAQWYCSDMYHRDPEAEGLRGETAEETIAALLIEYWLDVGRVDWLASFY